MNLGLGNLIELKRHLLNVSLQANTGYDAAITAIGKGVAGRFEQYCNRSFFRTVGDLYETNCDRLVVMLPRYPVESITKVEVRSNISDGWQDQGDPAQLLFNRRDYAGIVDVGGWLGGRYQRLRFTYTGGFWFDTTEDFSGTQPVGSTLRPDELFLAWLTQCEATWQLHDKLGRSIAEGPESRRNMNLSGLTLVPEVEATLKNFIRYQMT